MSKLENFINELSSSPRVFADILGSKLDLGDLGPYPLARNVALGDAGISVPFKRGEVRVKLNDVNAGPLNVSRVKGSFNINRATVEFSVGAMTLNGAYNLFAVQQPSVDVDTGGSMLPLASLGEATDPATLTVKQYDQLCQANDQRETLKKTPNGQTLLNNYGKYNDVYNAAFQNNSSLRAHWKGQGATAAMADQTSLALGQGETINKKGQLFGGEQVGYNDNAFAQSTYLFAALMKDYPEAANAIPSFSQSITNHTGNTQRSTVEMCGSQVYNKVNSAKMTFPTDSEVTSVYSALGKLAQNKYSDQHLNTLRECGFQLSQENISAMQEIYKESLRQGLEENLADLWQGDLLSSISESSFEFLLNDHGNGVVSTTLLKHTLLVSNLRLGDSNWKGAAGNISRKRMESAHFIRGLLVSRLADCLERRISAYALERIGDLHL